MLRSNAVRLTIAIFCLFALAGCGSGGSNTNGTLTLAATATDLTGGLFNVVATATYANSTATSTQGTPITIVLSVHTLNGTPQVFTSDLRADGAGTVSVSRSVQQTTENLFIDVTATTGGLSQTKTVVVPHL